MVSKNHPEEEDQFLDYKFTEIDAYNWSMKNERTGRSQNIHRLPEGKTNCIKSTWYEFRKNNQSTEKLSTCRLQCKKCKSANICK